MNDIFVHVHDAAAGDEFVPLDDWIRVECVELAAGKDARRVLDQAGVRGRDALRRLDALVLPFALKMIDGVRRSLAAGLSLKAVGGALGARLVRAPRFEPGAAPSSRMWAEIAAVNVMEAVLQYCDEVDLRGHERKKALEYATGEIQAAINRELHRSAADRV